MALTFYENIRPLVLERLGLDANAVNPTQDELDHWIRKGTILFLRDASTTLFPRLVKAALVTIDEVDLIAGNPVDILSTSVPVLYDTVNAEEKYAAILQIDLDLSAVSSGATNVFVPARRISRALLYKAKHGLYTDYHVYSPVYAWYDEMKIDFVPRRTTNEGKDGHVKIYYVAKPDDSGTDHLEDYINEAGIDAIIEYVVAMAWRQLGNIPAFQDAWTAWTAKLKALV